MNTWITCALYGLCFIFNMLDVLHTQLWIELGNTEGNPILAWVIETTGTVNSLYVIKIFIFIILGILLYKHQIRRKNDQQTLQL